MNTTTAAIAALTPPPMSRVLQEYDNRGGSEYGYNPNDDLHVWTPFLEHGPQRRMVAAIEPIMSNTMTVAAKVLCPISPQNGHDDRKH